MNIVKKKFHIKGNKDVSNDKIFLKKSFFSNLRNNIRDLYDFIIRRLFFKFFYKNFFKEQNYHIDLVLPSKGFSEQSRRNKLNSISKIKNKKIICLGCGNGHDLLNWLKYKPKSIIGIDILNYSKSWKKIQNYLLRKKIKTKIKFIQKDILKIKNTEKFDFIVSDAVFEHLTDFSKIIKKCCKLLKKNGVIYASYGPLWNCMGGDHFSARNNIQEGFNHLLLNKKNYQNFFKKNVKNIDEEIKSHGSAGIFVKKKLFSKLNSNDYMKIYKNNNLKSELTVVEFCPDAFHLLKNNKKLSKKLLKVTKFKNLENFYLKSQIIYLRKINF